MKKVLLSILCFIAVGTMFSQSITGRQVGVHINGWYLANGFYGYDPDSVVAGTVEYFDTLFLVSFVSITGAYDVYGSLMQDTPQPYGTMWYEEFGPEVTDYNDGDLDDTNELQTIAEVPGLQDSLADLRESIEEFEGGGPSANSFSPGRSFNTAFTPSADKWTYVSYTIRLSVSVPALGGTSVSTVTLQTSPPGTPSWTDRKQISNPVTFGLTVTFSNTDPDVYEVSAFIPPGQQVQLVNTGSGTHTETILFQQETIF